MNTGLYAGIGGLVNGDDQPLGAWWAYKRYADITDQMINVKAGSKIDGVAGTDSVTRKTIILLDTMTLEIKGFDSIAYLLDSGQVNVLVERIPSGSEVVTPPPMVSNQVLSIIGNTLTLTVDWTNSLDAYSITLTSLQR
jgi:hypothetical protein